MSKPAQHVVPHGDRWSVRTAGAKRASGTFETQAEAVRRAREMAMKRGTELYIHGRNGKVRERHSYGGDPHPPKG